MTDKIRDDILRENWAKASRLTLSGTLALFLMTRGAKTGANRIFEVFGLDWSALNPYAVALFGVPVVAALCAWSFWFARAFAKNHIDEVWFKRVITKIDLNQLDREARKLAIWSLILYIALPVIGLGTLEAKFLHGPFSFSKSGGFSCPKDCVPETGMFAHFWPKNGLPNVFDTPYRFEGNLTYVPLWQPLLWLGFGLAVALYAVLYSRMLWIPPRPHTKSLPLVRSAGAIPTESS